VLIRARKYPYGVTNAHFAVVSACASKADVASKYLLAVERLEPVVESENVCKQIQFLLSLDERDLFDDPNIC